MSGICGAWAFDGGDPGLGAVLSLLERRGPDGTRSSTDGPVALGHTLLATTPEALVEKLPLTDEDSGCTITADARIDNRDELIAALRLGGETRKIGDGELILRAYLEWDEECPKHLLGDFAFAIWDGRAKRLFCVRDHMGMRQFNYCHVGGKIFVFATEDVALVAHRAVPKELSQARIADYIDDLEGYDFTSTFFEAVRRLPPAHCMTVSRRGCELRRYWLLRPPPQLNLGSDQAYSEAFMRIFAEAVQCRLRNAGSIGAMLSGGLDSSSVVAVGARLLASCGNGPLHTFSAVGPDPATCLETTAVRTALTIDGLAPTLIEPHVFAAMADELVAALAEISNPFEVNASMLRGIYLTARRQGINVVLDGGAGDVVLTSANRVAALLSKGRLAPAIREIRGEIRFWKPAHPYLFFAYEFLSAAWVAFVPRKLRSMRRKRRLSKPLRVAAPDLIERVAFSERRMAADKHVDLNVLGDANRRAQSISHPNLTSGRERFDQLSSMFGVECRDPFMDIRLIDFCLSLPPEQLQTDGWRKLILRRSIEPLVPRDIAWRLGKDHLGWDHTTALLRQWPEWRESMIDPDSPLKHYLSGEALGNLRANPNPEPSGLILRFFALDRFLRRFGTNHVDRNGFET